MDLAGGTQAIATDSAHPCPTGSPRGARAERGGLPRPDADRPSPSTRPSRIDGEDFNQANAAFERGLVEQPTHLGEARRHEVTIEVSASPAAAPGPRGRAGRRAGAGRSRWTTVNDGPGEHSCLLLATCRGPRQPSLQKRRSLTSQRRRHDRGVAVSAAVRIRQHGYRLLEDLSTSARRRRPGAGRQDAR